MGMILMILWFYDNPTPKLKSIDIFWKGSKKPYISPLFLEMTEWFWLKVKQKLYKTLPVEFLPDLFSFQH